MRCIVFTLTVLSVLLVGSSRVQGATVMGVDFGTEFIKVCASKGNTIDIVLNEQTRRKNNNYLGFRGDDRWFGEDAKNLAARFPANMFASVSRLTGLGFDHPEDQIYLDHFKHVLQLPYKLMNNTNRGTVSISTLNNPEVTYSVEELLAMMWTHLKDITLKDREITEKNHPVDAAVTVPAFWNMRMRKALVDAATVAGVKVVSLMHPTVATALQFGMQHQGFGNETKHAIILDVGSAKTEVGIFTFSEAEIEEGEKRPKLAHSMGTMTTKYIGSDPTLGGRNWDLCIAEELQRQFTAKFPKLPKPLNGTTVAQFKSTYSLMRAANQLKETLSANAAATPVTVEGIAPDRDFSSKMNREELEQLCAPLFKRAVDLVVESVKKSGLEMDDITRFELMGGGSRIPKLIDDLAQAYGNSIDRTLNTDEAAAWGAAYYAARQSGFRVRSFKVVDPYPINLDVVLSAKKDSATDDKARKPAAREFFGTVVPGLTKSLSVKRSDDFTIYLQDRATEEVFSSVKVEGLNSALETMGAFEPAIEHENNTYVSRVEIKLADNFQITTGNAEVKVSYVANVTKRIKVPVNETNEGDNSTSTEAEVEGAAKVEQAGADAEKKPEDAEKETAEKADETKEETEKPEGDAEAGANATDVEDTNSTKKKKVKKVWVTVSKLETKRKTRQLVGSVDFHGYPAPMTSDDIAAAKATLAGLEAADEQKRLLSQAKNDLETYLHHVKMDGILENSEIAELKMMTDEQKEAIEKKVAEVQEWVEDGEGSYDSASLDMFVEKMQELKAATSDVETPYLAHKAEQAEILRNATETKKKEKEAAKKKAKQEARKAEQEAKKKAEEEAQKAKDAEEAKEEEKQFEEEGEEPKTEDNGQKTGDEEKKEEDL